MTIRDWVASKLKTDEGYKVENNGDRGCVVTRRSMPDAHVYCPDTSDTEPFTSGDLEDALEEMPTLQFVATVKRLVANDTYTLADEQGVAIGGLGALKAALYSDWNVGEYKTSEQSFVQRRLDGNANVVSWRRRGYSAYEIVRKGRLRDLSIVTVQPYELTSDEVYQLLARHDGLAVDAIVTTNPNCQGFAPGTFDAANHAATELITFKDFLASLRQPWTQ